MQLGKKLLPALVLLMGTSALGQMANSDHDLTGDINGLTEICLPCHTPHNVEAGVTQSDAPLWNHQVTQGTFSTYTTVAGSTAGNVDGPSRLCLGCHDGVTAMDNYGGTTGGSQVMTGGAVVGTDLSDDHPVGVIYPTTGQYVAAATVTTTGGLRLYSVNGNSRVECQTCHDPHDTTNSKFLRKTNAASALCITCHTK